MLRNFIVIIWFFFLLYGAAHAAPESEYSLLYLTINTENAVKSVIHRCYKDKKNKIWITREDAQKMGFPLSPRSPVVIKNQAYILLDSYQQIEYNLDEQALILTIKKPMDWYQQPKVTVIPLENVGFRPAQAGFFINYDVSSSYDNSFRFRNWPNAFTEAGLFTHYGVGLSSFLVGGDSVRQQNNIMRLDSTWIIDEPEHIRSWRFGDSISSGLSWNGATRFAGIQYATNFNTQPSLITFPQPAIRGEAYLPSSVEVLMNGSQLYQKSVERGPYYLTQLPTVTGANQMQVMTTDLLGRQQLSTFSYYTSPVLLKPGLAAYSFEAGSIRSDYGIANNHYGRGVMVGTYSLGLTERYTAGVHAEILKEQQTLGFSNDYLINNYGIASLGFAGSLASGQNAWFCKDLKRGAGGLVNLGFRRQTDFLSYGVQSTLATHDYLQIGTFHDKAYPNFTLQSFVGISTANLGSVSVTYTDLNNSFNLFRTAPYEYLLPDSKVLMVSYSKNLFQRLFFTVGGLADLKNTTNKQIFATLILPLDGGNKSVSLNEYSQNNQHQENIQFIKNRPLGNGYGYQLTAANNRTSPVIGTFDIQTNKGLLGARYVNIQGANNVELNARGSIINFANRVFLARYVDQGFALVDTSGFKNVDVYSRNQLIGKTNKSGYLYIPELLAYQRNDIRIGTDNLPLNTQLDEITQTVTPYYKSGVLVKFAVKSTKSILLSLTQSNGTPIPAGADVYIDANPIPLPVGYGGEVFINSSMADSLVGRVVWDNHSCQFKLNIHPSNKIIRKESALCY